MNSIEVNLITELEKISLSPDFLTEEQEQQIIRLINERVSRILEPHTIDILWKGKAKDGVIFSRETVSCINNIGRADTFESYYITVDAKGVWAWVCNHRKSVWIKNLRSSNTSGGVINEITGQSIDVRREEIFEKTDTIIAVPMHYENVLYGIYSIEWLKSERVNEQTRKDIESISESIARIRWKFKNSKENIEHTFKAIEMFRKTLPTLGLESREVFIVHGHDEDLKGKVVSFLKKSSLKPIILSEQPDKGRTIVEKLEAHASVPFVIVLLTKDDIGGKDEKSLNPRARQNVILELGYFYGKLTRQRVCCLYEEGVELPSDILGITYIPYDENWEITLKRELSEVFKDLSSAADGTLPIVHNELPLESVTQGEA